MFLNNFKKVKILYKAYLIYFILLIFSIFMLSGCGGGPCDYPDDRARDGSRCGNRAASVRPGGRNPDTDWIKWVIGIGALGAFVYYISSETGSNRSDSGTNQSFNNKSNQSSKQSNSSDQDNFYDDLNIDNQNEGDNSSLKNYTNPKLKLSTSSQNDRNTPNRPQKIIYSSNKYKEEVKTVIKNNFGYEINSSNTNSFDKIINEYKKLGKNHYDSALMFMLIEMNVKDVLSNQSSKIIDKQTKNMLRVIEKCSDPRLRILAKINELRKKHNLSKV